MLATIEAQNLSLFQQLTPEEQEIVVKALERFQAAEASPPAAEDAFVERLAGGSFSRSEVLKLEMETLARWFERRRELLRETLTASEVAQLLGTTRQTPHDRVKSQTLLAVRDNGALRFPIWQFDPEGTNGVIEGLPAVLKALAGSDFAKLNWLVRPNPILDGLTPVAALKQGQQERVVQEALAIGEQ